jgi:two-component system, NtrC family, sensor kinase
MAGRTLSSRILAGFVVLIAVFTATMVWIVAYMDDLRSEIAVIRTRYLRLTIAAKDLAGQQQVLYAYLKEEMPGEGTPNAVERRVTRMRDNRTQLLSQLADTLDAMRSLPRGHGAVVVRYLDKVSGVERSVSGLDPRYAELLAAPPIERNLRADPPVVDPARLAIAQAARDTLLTAENRLLISLSELADSLRVRTERIAANLEYNARRLRVFTGAMGVIAVAVGLFITAWVTLSLRPLGRLRTAARRIAAGEYASRIDERGPAEVADLAREFNAMGQAVQERERDVVRSERLAAVGKMAAMITHEVRNPLSSIGLNTELLEEELAALSAGDEAKQLCRAIGREVDRLTAITEEYLSFARLPTPRLAAGSVVTLVDDLARFVRDDLAGRNVVLTVEHARDVPLARLDESQIRQSIFNLLRNAAEAVSAHGGGNVWIRTRGSDATVVIEVSDDGPGIPADLRERLFDPFVSTKDGGTGLGLALTHQIVRDHGGTIAVNSPPGTGATFTIELPRAVDRDRTAT